MLFKVPKLTKQLYVYTVFRTELKFLELILKIGSNVIRIHDYCNLWRRSNSLRCQAMSPTRTRMQVSAAPLFSLPFLTAIWLPHGQLWAILKGRAHSVLQGISPTLKAWPRPFLPSPPPQSSKSVRPLLDEQPPTLNFGELDSPLKCILVQKSKDSFFKTKNFISNNELRTHLNVEIWIHSCKI